MLLKCDFYRPQLSSSSKSQDSFSVLSSDKADKSLPAAWSVTSIRPSSAFCHPSSDVCLSRALSNNRQLRQGLFQFSYLLIRHLRAGKLKLSQINKRLERRKVRDLRVGKPKPLQFVKFL